MLPCCVFSYACLKGTTHMACSPLLCVFGQACAEHLVSGGFTSPSLMGAQVNSAGGLLAGVMANQRPGLFSAMVMKVCLGGGGGVRKKEGDQHGDNN